MDTADVDFTAQPGEKGAQHISSTLANHLFSAAQAHLLPVVHLASLILPSSHLTLKDAVASTWMDIFYPDGVMDQIHAEHGLSDERRARYAARTGPDTFDMLLTLPYILIPRDELQATLREAREKAAAEEQRRVQDKVDTWNRQVNPS